MSARSIRSSMLFAALFAGAAVCPAALHAQQGAVADRGITADQVSTVVTVAGATDVASTAGPRVASAGVTKPASAQPSLGLQPKDEPHVGMGANLALMGAGVATVVVGLLVGGNAGTVIALTGGVLSFVGLYRYLR